jgi:hypothetical protein
MGLSFRLVQELSPWNPLSTRVAPFGEREFTFVLMKGAVMDMMWLFAAVWVALLLGVIIVYKKSVWPTVSKWVMPLSRLLFLALPLPNLWI